MTGWRVWMCGLALSVTAAPLARGGGVDAPSAAPDSIATVADPALALASGTPDADSLGASEPPEDAPEDRDYELERSSAIAPSEIEVGYSLASLAHGRLTQRRRVQVREAGVEAEVREGRGDALAGAALGARVPGGWLALGRASPRWGRGLLVGSPAEPWRAGGLVRLSEIARPREGDAVEFRHPGPLALDGIAAHLRHDVFTAASLAAGSAALELAVTRALEEHMPRGLAGLRLSRPGAEAEAAMDARGSWRLEATRAAARRGLSLGMRLGHFDFRGVQRPRIAPPPAAFGASLDGVPRHGLQARLEGSCWRFPGGQTGHRGALEVSADMAQHESIAMGLEERRGERRLTSGPASAGALRQGVWGEWRRGGPELAMNLRHEWWGGAGGLRERLRELASAELESRPWRGTSASLTVWLYRTIASDPQYVTESEADRTIWRVVSGAGHRTRLRVNFPAAGGMVRAAITVSQSGGTSPPPHWTLDWTRRARTR